MGRETVSVWTFVGIAIILIFIVAKLEPDVTRTTYKICSGDECYTAKCYRSFRDGCASIVLKNGERMEICGTYTVQKLKGEQ